MVKHYLVILGLIIFFLSWGCSSGPKPSISSTEPELRQQALIDLERRGQLQRRLDIVTELVTDDPDPLVRVLAIAYLGKYKYREGMPALIAGLSDKEVIVREAAVKSLGVLGDTQAVKPLLNLLADDSSSMVRRATAQTLGELGDSRALQGLVQRLEDIDPSVAYAALKALQKITKQTFGKNIEQWEKWLKGQNE